MQRRSELGQGRLSGLLWFVVLALAIYAAWHLAPAYYANYSLEDRMGEIARNAYTIKGEDSLRQQLYSAAEEYHLDTYFTPYDFTIQRTVGRIKVSVKYAREIQVLPGLKPHRFQFTASADQPMF